MVHAEGRIVGVRPSTARCARAQDEAIPWVPARTHLILSSASGDAAAPVEGRTSLMQQIALIGVGRNPSFGSTDGDKWIWAFAETPE